MNRPRVVVLCNVLICGEDGLAACRYVLPVAEAELACGEEAFSLVSCAEAAEVELHDNSHPFASRGLNSMNCMKEAMSMPQASILNVVSCFVEFRVVR